MTGDTDLLRFSVLAADKDPKKVRLLPFPQKGIALSGAELRFLRKRVAKSSKDFAQLLGVTSEQYSRIENGATLKPSNDKLARLLVMGLSVIEALKQPELMERVVKQTWTSVVGPEQRIIARVDSVQGWTVKTKAA